MRIRFTHRFHLRFDFIVEIRSVDKAKHNIFAWWTSLRPFIGIHFSSEDMVRHLVDVLSYMTSMLIVSRDQNFCYWVVLVTNFTFLICYGFLVTSIIDALGRSFAVSRQLIATHKQAQMIARQVIYNYKD